MIEMNINRGIKQRVGLVLTVVFLLALFVARPAFAASVSVSATVNGGPVDVSASATFPPDESGTLSVYRDSTFIGGNSGSGTIAWTGTIEGAGLTNGEHTVRATAGGAEATNTFVIENPESVSVNAPSLPQAPMDVTGSAKFYERLNPGDITGYVYIRKLSPEATTGGDTLRAGSYTTPSVTYSCQDMNLITGLIDVANWTNGQWKIRAQAKGANNASIYADTIITIENPISISASVPSKPTAPMDVTGTAQFISRLSSEKSTGQIKIQKRRAGASTWYSTGAYKTYYEPVVNFSCSDMSSGLIDVGNWLNGDWEIRAAAIAANESTKGDIHVITIENPIAVSVSAPSQPKKPANVTANAQFIARKNDAWTGQIRIRRRRHGASTWSSICSKNYYEAMAAFDLQADCGTLLDVATWSNGDWDIGATAEAANGAYITDIQIITVDNTPQINASLPRYVSGDFDITGSAVFTEPLSDFKGRVYINIDKMSTSGALIKNYNAGDPAGFSYAEIAGAPLDADTLGHGGHVAYIRGYARNGSWSDWLAVPFTTGPPEADGSGNLKIVIP